VAYYLLRDHLIIVDFFQFDPNGRFFFYYLRLSRFGFGEKADYKLIIGISDLEALRTEPIEDDLVEHRDMLG
jgi:hypothetical protein